MARLNEELERNAFNHDEAAGREAVLQAKADELEGEVAVLSRERDLFSRHVDNLQAALERSEARYESEVTQLVARSVFFYISHSPPSPCAHPPVSPCTGVTLTTRCLSLPFAFVPPSPLSPPFQAALRSSMADDLRKLEADFETASAAYEEEHDKCAALEGQVQALEAAAGDTDDASGYSGRQAKQMAALEAKLSGLENDLVEARAAAESERKAAAQLVYRNRSLASDCDEATDKLTRATTEVQAMTVAKRTLEIRVRDLQQQLSFEQDRAAQREVAILGLETKVRCPSAMA